MSQQEFLKLFKRESSDFQGEIPQSYLNSTEKITAEEFGWFFMGNSMNHFGNFSSEKCRISPEEFGEIFHGGLKKCFLKLRWIFFTTLNSFCGVCRFFFEFFLTNWSIKFLLNLLDFLKELLLLYVLS